MKARWMLYGVLVFASLRSEAQLRIPMNRLLTLHKNKQYGELYKEAIDIRKNEAYGKNYAIDYLIASALHGSGLHEKAMTWLDHLLDSYAMPVRLRTSFLQTKASWSSGRTVADQGRGLALAAIRMEIEPASVQGKEGRSNKCSRTVAERDAAGAASMSERLTDVVSKLIPVQRGDSTAGMDTLRRVMAGRYKITVRERFIHVAPLNTRKTAIDSIDAELERVAAYYRRAFGLEDPPYYIVVGSMPELASLRKLALHVHGLKVPNENLGYSSTGDMTMFARATPGRTGTMQHELFHLMVRTTIGDVPAWLDEGMASSFENAKWKGEDLKGVQDYAGNFRLDALRAGRSMGHGWSVPPLDTLISMSWERFRGLPNEPECVSGYHYALSKHFVFYLQDRGVMKAVLEEYRNAEVPETSEGPIFRADREMIMAVLREPISAIQADFNRWFFEKFGFRVYRE
ncbi:MAG: hypothetical protein IPK70_07145 [Flavobacteriales bacterium]|jgi:hypothetical protein|nr:hypothetical protein [Flavobacteriales bacterium]